MERQRQFASAILDGFESYFVSFQKITLAATARFDQANWQAVQRASLDRIDLYKSSILEVQKEGFFSNYSKIKKQKLTN